MCACSPPPSPLLELAPEREVPLDELGCLLQHHLAKVRGHHLLPVPGGGEAPREQPRAAAKVEEAARGGGGEEAVADEGGLGADKGGEGVWRTGGCR